ncbi:anti-Muellerian hormone type-2 receptor-like [Brachyistius frenatus]|uniref:anti-Muellerian hormone type-2 receptor-like n=1 Tax=Brachyistius frenatus TaxID=100188 RepID=UPI0037E7B57F
MMLPWQLLLAVGWMCVSSQHMLLRRRCVFRVTRPRSIQQYGAAGSVSGSVQVCERTRCCVGYFHINNSQPEVDVLACDVVEKFCPDSTCRAQTRSDILKCVCNTDLCNSDITWSPEPEQAPPTSPSPADGNMQTAALLVGMLLIGLFIVLFIVLAVRRRNCSQQKKERPASSCEGDSAPPPCSCLTTITCDADITGVELQQIVGRGHFGTVFRGRLRGCVVAVKVFPAGWTQRFSSERQVYELPLMKHDAIVSFLGAGRKHADSSGFIVLQFAEHGSLHSFLWKHTSSWTSSLKLCRSFSQGLSYLHSDLLLHDVHKPAVAYRDLSSSNVLVRADGTCVLCDFGCSTIVRSCSGSRCWWDDTSAVEGPAPLGTLHYVAPEVLEGSVNISSSCFLMQGDVYALGLLIWEVLMRCSDLFKGHVVPHHLLPYESELGADVTRERLVLLVSHLDRRPSVPEHWELLPQGAALTELLTDCWDGDPDARLSAHCVLDRLLSLQP